KQFLLFLPFRGISLLVLDECELSLGKLLNPHHTFPFAILYKHHVARMNAHNEGSAVTAVWARIIKILLVSVEHRNGLARPFPFRILPDVIAVVIPALDVAICITVSVSD